CNDQPSETDSRRTWRNSGMGSPPMKTPSPCLAHAGRWLLNRRDFLRFGGTGLGGIALTALLAEQGLLGADKSPIRPQWSPERPSAPRAPHFPAKAQNVLVI